MQVDVLYPMCLIAKFLLQEIWEGKTIFNKMDIDRMLIDNGYEPSSVINSAKPLIELVLCSKNVKQNLSSLFY
jgi:hypothetical protein